MNRYIGLPFDYRGEKGVNCVTLVEKILFEQKGYSLWLSKDYDDPFNIVRTDKHAVQRELDQNLYRVHLGRLSEKDFHKIEKYDIILLRILRSPTHLGIINDSSSFLSIIDGSTSELFPLSSSWCNRVIGVYRWL